MSVPRKFMGCGVGLRTRHYPAMVEGGVQVDWIEAVSENFMRRGGRPLAVLERVRQDHAVALHGVSMCIGSADPLNPVYLADLKDLVQRIAPALVTDHLCWGSAHGAYAHDLLPMPFTEEALAHVVQRVRQVQDVLGRQIALENVSSYAQFAASQMPEWEFLAAVAQQADCGILLDVNNVFVNAFNHHFSAATYLAGIPGERVVQMHLAGHTHCGTHLLDSHIGPVPADVWSLYRHAIQRFGPISTLIEWDAEVPELPVLLSEAQRANDIIQDVQQLRGNAA